MTDALYLFIHGCAMLIYMILLVIVSCTNVSPIVAKRVSEMPFDHLATL